MLANIYWAPPRTQQSLAHLILIYPWIDGDLEQQVRSLAKVTQIVGRGSRSLNQQVHCPLEKGDTGFSWWDHVL